MYAGLSALSTKSKKLRYLPTLFANLSRSVSSFSVHWPSLSFVYCRNYFKNISFIHYLQSIAVSTTTYGIEYFSDWRPQGQTYLESPSGQEDHTKVQAVPSSLFFCSSKLPRILLKVVMKSWDKTRLNYS